MTQINSRGVARLSNMITRSPGLNEPPQDRSAGRGRGPTKRIRLDIKAKRARRADIHTPSQGSQVPYYLDKLDYLISSNK